MGAGSSDHVGAMHMIPLEDRACRHIIAQLESPRAAQRPDAPVALAPEQGRSLLDDLTKLTDPRSDAADRVRWARCWLRNGSQVW